MMLGMDPATLQQLFGMLWGGGGQGGGGVGQPGTPSFGGSGGVPYGTPSAGTPTAGIPASPQDVTPMPVEPQQPWRLQMPTMDNLKGALGMSVPPPSPMMPPTSGVPNPGVSGVGMAPTSLGEALQPAPGTPTPMPRPPTLGEPTPGNYGGSPETNPLLKPQGANAPGGQAQRGPTDIAKLLGGIKQPSGPDVVKPSTPGAPQVRPAQSSELMNLLTALFGGHTRSQRMPTTLGQSLEGKPAAWGGLYG